MPRPDCALRSKRLTSRAQRIVPGLAGTAVAQQDSLAGDGPVLQRHAPVLREVRMRHRQGVVEKAVLWWRRTSTHKRRRPQPGSSRLPQLSPSSFFLNHDLNLVRTSSRRVLLGPSQRPRNAILSGQRTVVMNREYSLRGLPLATQSELVSGGRIRARKGGADGRVGCCAAGTDIQRKAAGGT